MSDLDARVIEFVQQVTSAMGLKLEAEVEETPDHLRINLTGEGAAALLPRNGEALDALQVIVNTVFGRDARGDRHYVVDAQAYRKGKDIELQQTAKTLMDKVRATGTPEEIGPLNPYARRLVHLTVAEDDALSSESIGDAFLKTIVISKKRGWRRRWRHATPPPGRGGIGVVRLSGADAARIAALLLPRHDLVPRLATFARLIDPTTGVLLDHVVATRFVAPHSYTGEDVVEISAHGSPVLLRRIVELVIALGARLAEPGEFTFRAYLNGRLDLPQAEAVADLVDAVTPLQARAAMDQLDGTLTMAIASIDAALFDLSAKLEASLDYPEEGFHFSSKPGTLAEAAQIRDALARLSEAGRTGRVIREGRTVVIAGRPNAGKSSLFNALAGAARAIVTDIPGTTRDLLTERIDIEGLAVTLVDTAGLREARDEIEAEGVKRARDAQQVAALQLIVIDATQPLSIDDRALITDAGIPRVIVASKQDLPRAWTAIDLGVTAGDLVEVSARTGLGLSDLRQRVAAALITSEDLRDPPAISNMRHLALVDEALQAMTHAEQALTSGATEELVLIDLGRARRALEEITGRRTTDDLLAHIFARFCLGK